MSVANTTSEEMSVLMCIMQYHRWLLNGKLDIMLWIFVCGRSIEKKYCVNTFCNNDDDDDDEDEDEDEEDYYLC